MPCSLRELSPGPSHSCSAMGREGCREGWQGCPGEGRRGTAPGSGTKPFMPRQKRDAQLPTLPNTAHSRLNPGSWAPAHSVPLQEGESQGCSEPVQEERAGFPGKGSGMAAQPQTTQESLQQSNHLWDALWKPRAQAWPWGSSSDTKGTGWSPQKLRTRMGEHTNPSWLRGENHSQTSGTWGFTCLCQVPWTHQCQMNILGFSLTCNW